MQHHNMSWIEVQFLKKGVDILCECRQTLMYTYVFAYYLIKNNQSIIFEDNQRDLESATEKLSEYLEREITQDNISVIKQKVQDKYRYTLLCHIFPSQLIYILLSFLVDIVNRDDEPYWITWWKAIDWTSGRIIEERLIRLALRFWLTI